ncbi:hypothetical protein A2Z23_02305 [Candidatus Curtissbacteria bacterium RBG_16_39_7]|uniref:Uncharacterized protein n=1 Tax=Candidatus Curtissbacteria bacterium RBG_16_39_7 TaxID=1797707 RepID=A0A1F5G2T4_9BACT|nr:MAG: hypothetical protein A2Z23_02305 [Candidatus Curtissbacteria bacterium RBG_16_39_7]
MSEKVQDQDQTYEEAKNKVVRHRVREDVAEGIKHLKKGERRRLIAASLATPDQTPESLEEVTDRIAKVKVKSK